MKMSLELAFMRTGRAVRLAAILLSLAALPAVAGVRLATPFSDGMVLQRDADVPVWGRADPGERVEVEFAGQRVETTAGEDGRWLVRLAPMAASGEGRVLRANGAAVSDVLVGEVWFCCGQSNMEVPLVGDPGYSDREGRRVAAATRLDDVRYACASGREWSPAPRDEARRPVAWKRFVPENLGRAPSFSAVGAYFALALHEALDVPVGIVGAYRGGTGIDPWIPREGYEGAPETLAPMRDWKTVGPDEWTDALKSGPVNGSHQQPSVLWNEMVAPWRPMAMKGFIWYQGEHNAAEGDLYRDKMHALYDGWAKAFGNPGLKLYFVQLAPWKSSWWDIWMAQAKFAEEEPNAGMAVSADVGSSRSIHPVDKGPLGRRLAALALARDYGFESLEAESPALRWVRADGDRLILSFAHAGGWYVYDDARSGFPVPFELAGADGTWKPARIANAKEGGSVAGNLEGADIVLQADGVPHPVKARHLFQPPWKGTVFAASGLPLGPFETGLSDPVAYIAERLAAGETSVVVPKGDYRLALPEDRTVYFSLKGLKDATIDFSGSRLWGETKSRMFEIQSCTNLVLRNVAVDYPFDLPYTQAEIVGVDAEKNWRVRIVPGYPRPSEAQLAARIWPVQAYSADGERIVNPMRFRDGIRIERLEEDEYRISGGLDRCGDVGDIAVWSVPETTRRVSDTAFTLRDCSGCALEDVAVHATPMGCGFIEWSAEGNSYRRCRLDRCSLEDDPVPRGMKRLRSGNHDAFNSRGAFRGPTLDGCRLAWHCDDCVNISGFYVLVLRQEGRTLRVSPLSNGLPLSPGDTCQAQTPDGGCPPDVAVAACAPDGEPTEEEKALIASMPFWPGARDSWFRKAFRVELASDSELPPGSVLVSNRRQGNGFIVRNCDFGPNRARALQIKASDGLIENNRMRGLEMSAIDVTSEPVPFMEGGCSRNVTIAGNDIEGCGGGIVVSGVTPGGAPLAAGAHRDIRIVDNRVVSPAPALKAVGCRGLVVSGNDFTTTDGGEAVELVNCEEVDKN